MLSPCATASLAIPQRCSRPVGAQANTRMAQPACRSSRQHQRQRRQQPPPVAVAAARPPCCRAAACQAAGRFDTHGGWVGDPPALSDEEGLSSIDEQAAPGGNEQPPAGCAQAEAAKPNGGSMQHDRWRVPLPPHLHGKAPRKHWNANALAFLGDSVWELYARRRFFYPPSARDSYFELVVKHVRAETQEKLHQKLVSGNFLSETERDVLRWGRNATGVTPKRLSDTGLKRATYRAATAIECLCGYLYLSDPERLHEMMGLLGLGDAPAPGEAAAGERNGSASAGSSGYSSDISSMESEG